METFSRDFKENVTELRRRLNNTPHEQRIDWHDGDPTATLAAETFVQITEYDALSRMTRHYNWHRGLDSRVAVYEPTYNQRDVLLSERLTTRATKTAASFDATHPDTQSVLAIREIRYDAKGQKQSLTRGNGTITHYDYDEKTFRLRQQGDAHSKATACIRYDALSASAPTSDDASE